MLQRLRTVVSRATFVVAAALVLVGYPVAASADTTPTTTGPTDATGQPTGPQKPTGADASTYHYNATTGMWENDYYIWNPNTGQTTPKTSQSYSYNPATGQWDTGQYKYDAGAGAYVPNTPTPAATTSTAPTISNTGAGSTNTIGTNANGPGANATFNNFYNASISNKVTSTAQSGDAGVTGNTTAGNATSGDATAASNTLNLLQSNTSFAASGNVATFSSDINGDVVGDLLLDPAVLASLQPQNGGNVPANITVNSQGNGQINNDINLHAGTGNATVANNTTGGNAASGNATASANILNLTSDNLSLGSWFGILFINVFGSWNGSFGVNTAAGNLPGGSGGADNTAAGQTPETSNQSSQTFAANTAGSGLHQAFVLASQTGSTNGNESLANSSDSPASSSHHAVLAASTIKGQTPTLHNGTSKWQFAAGGLSLSIALVVIERMLEHRKTSKATA